MKIKLTTFCILAVLIIYSCSKEQPNITSKNSSQFSINDSLQKYKDSDSISIIQGDGLFTLNVGKANEHSYAFYVEGDSTTIFYQRKISEQWKPTDTLHYANFRSFAETTDLNNDGYPDAILASAEDEAHITENIVFIYNVKRGRFEHNAFYDLTNIAYNRKGNFIQSSSLDGAGSCQQKEKYLITRDSLTLEAGISICPDNNNLEMGILEYYKIKNNKRITTSKVTGKMETLWKTFDNTFWNSQND